LFSLLVQTNHEIKRTTKGIDNKRSYLQVSKSQIQMSSHISDYANPRKLTPTKINEITVSRCSPI